MSSHPSAAELYERVRGRIPHLSFGTVYRNLKLLREQGMVTELSLGSSASLWDGNPSPHYHFTCQGCGQILDLPVSLKLDCYDEIEAQTGVRITGHRAEFYGQCVGCLRRSGQAIAMPGAVREAVLSRLG